MRLDKVFFGSFFCGLSACLCLRNTPDYEYSFMVSRECSRVDSHDILSGLPLWFVYDYLDRSGPLRWFFPGMLVHTGTLRRT